MKLKSSLGIRIIFVTSISFQYCTANGYYDMLYRREKPVNQLNHVHEPIGAPKSQEMMVEVEEEVDSHIEDKLMKMRNAVNKIIKSRVSSKPNTNIAKNIILIVGEDVSGSTITTARKYKQDCLDGYFNRAKHEHVKSSFKDYATVVSECYNDVEPDQACASTAILTGSPNNRGTIAVNHEIPYGVHPQGIQPHQRLASIAAWAQEAGKYTGLVTTGRVTSPGVSPYYGNIANHHWESDFDIHKDLATSRGADLATQLIHGETGRNLNVIFGGGRKKFVPGQRFGGERLDRRNLIKEWFNSKQNGREHTYIDSRDSLHKVCKHNEFVLGLFNLENLDTNDNPSLPEMTASAIQLLNRANDDDGYVLFVQASKVFSDDDFNEEEALIRQHFDIVETMYMALLMTDPEETLIITTTDHANRKSECDPEYDSDEDLSDVDSDNVYTATGKNDTIEDLLNAFGTRVTAIYEQDEIKRVSNKSCNVRNNGDDAKVLSHGPFSQLFKGSILQYWIPHIAAYAACIGNGLHACDY